MITNGERFAIVSAKHGLSVEPGDALLEIEDRTGGSDVLVQRGESGISESLTVMQAHGIHARPAGLIAAFAKASRADIAISIADRTANAKSAVALMSLGVRHGDRITLTASGEGAEEAVRDLKKLIAGIHEAPEEPRSHVANAPPPPRQHGDRLVGVVASRGLAVGRAVTLRNAEIQVNEAGRGIAHESAEFERGRAEVRGRLEALATSASGAARDVIAAHLEFLDDWELVGAARRTIALGKSAAFAWRRAVRDSADTLRSLGDARIAERVDDLLDLESQVLAALTGEALAIVRELPERAILIADELKPSQFVALDATRLAGICLAGGGPTSHVAILASAVGVPMLAALGPAALDIEDGDWLVLDADHGRLVIRPDRAALAAAEQLLAERRAATADRTRRGACGLPDGGRRTHRGLSRILARRRRRTSQ